MNNNYRINEGLVSENDLELILKKLPVIADENMIYILPELSEEKDYINEYSPDLNKIAKKENIPCTIIYDKENYEYLSLRDSEILLPFIISLSASAGFELIKFFVIRFFENKNNLKVRIVTKKEKDADYRKIEIEGDTDGVVRALEILKDGDKGEL